MRVAPTCTWCILSELPRRSCSSAAVGCIPGEPGLLPPTTALEMRSPDPMQFIEPRSQRCREALRCCHRRACPAGSHHLGEQSGGPPRVRARPKPLSFTPWTVSLPTSLPTSETRRWWNPWRRRGFETSSRPRIHVAPATHRPRSLPFAKLALRSGSSSPAESDRVASDPHRVLEATRCLGMLPSLGLRSRGHRRADPKADSNGRSASTHAPKSTNRTTTPTDSRRKTRRTSTVSTARIAGVAADGDPHQTVGWRPRSKKRTGWSGARRREARCDDTRSGATRC